MEVDGYKENLMNSWTCHRELNVQAGGGSVMVWNMCSWRDMRSLIRLDTNLTGDRYVNILSFGRPREISAGQSDTTHVQNYYRVAQGALF
ncbi:hypothetical protein TNCT_384461 [Trichonephila clavata]|uniref:Uncharacterized protein n=1 Tax=Trichonephila clavata TaxID=2740835 RepID=A0A8X6L344_TRICU|nr:hypothetical protein TNCT_384461 [Trichonephila clavata]